MEPARRDGAGAGAERRGQRYFFKYLYIRFPGAGPALRHGPARQGLGAGGSRRRAGAYTAGGAAGGRAKKPPSAQMADGGHPMMLSGPLRPRFDVVPPRSRLTTRLARFAGRERLSLTNNTLHKTLRYFLLTLLTYLPFNLIINLKTCILFGSRGQGYFFKYLLTGFRDRGGPDDVAVHDSPDVELD